MSHYCLLLHIFYPWHNSFCAFSFGCPCMKKVMLGTTKPELMFYEYLSVPHFNYEEFKENAIMRLKILRKVENNIIDTTTIKTIDQDVNSHFCLRLLCSHARWSSNWFITQETQFFKQKLLARLSEVRGFFLNKVWPHLNVTENIEHSSNYNFGYHNTRNYTNKVKVHFTKCSDVIPKRTHKLQAGYLSLDDDEVLISLLTEIFSLRLDKEMKELYEKVVGDFDERLAELNKSLFANGTTNKPAVTGNIMGNSEFFPLCIKGLLERLKTQKHLKYKDRQMLCLFLKDIGMSLNECVDFFRSNFSCTQDDFNKNYLYNIRHNYGLEGKRANYGSFKCTKVFGFSDDRVSFGCPFINNHDFVKLNSDIEDLNRDAMKCCSKVGETVLGKEFEEPFQSPADYFRIIYKGKQV